MNILFVIPNLGLGGAQSFLLRMLSAFPKEHNIYLFDIHPKQKEIEILSNLTRNIKIYSSLYERFEIILSKYPKVFIRLLNLINRHFSIRNRTDKSYFNRILKKKNIQLINSHMYLADSFVFHNCKLNIPKISSFHGCYNLIGESDKNSDNLIREIQEILNSYSGIIIAAEKHKLVFPKFETRQNITIEKIYYGYEQQEIEKSGSKNPQNLNPNTFVFGMVARGDKTKGWQEAIDAFKMLQTEFADIYIVLCGGTEYLDKLKRTYANNEHIIFTGNIRKPIDYIKVFNVGLLPTYFPAESLPNTVIEYLYCGKPVIASDWAEIPMMLEFEGELAGELVPLREGKVDTEKLYLAMKSYLKDHEKLTKHSKLAKKAFSKFEMKKCTESYINFFRTFTNNG
jgi:glycosyltransferase involved in cell wall biosynthesis